MPRVTIAISSGFTELLEHHIFQNRKEEEEEEEELLLWYDLFDP